MEEQGTKHASAFLLILLLGALGLFGMLLFIFFTPLFFSLLLAGIFHPLYERVLILIERKTIRRKDKNLLRNFLYSTRSSLAALIIVILIILLVLIPFFFVGALFVNEASEVYTQVSEEMPTMAGWQELLDKSPTLKKAYDYMTLKFKTDKQNLAEQLMPVLKKIADGILGFGASIFGNLILVGIDVFMLLLAVYYLLQDGKELGIFLMRLSPLKSRDELKIYEMFTVMGKGVIIGNTVSAVAQGLLAALGFFIFGVPKPVFLFVLTTFFSLIPFLGPSLVCIPAVAYLFYIKSYLNAILLLAYTLLLVTTIDHFVKPIFIGGKLKIHPFLILISIIGGLEIFGMMGIFYGPLIVTVFQTLAEIYMCESEERSAAQ
ncbi:MAG: AI-2E family transporter [Candidatus Wallbacteria bacterium]|nr:AI-2E family transporter [Candidatus Wallbacteria bacterium]